MTSILSLLCAPGFAFAAPPTPWHEWTAPELEQDLVGDVDDTNPTTQKALQDTLWIADWTHDTGAPCSEAGWTHADNRILNNGANYWHFEGGFTSTAGIAGTSAAVGYHDNACCAAAGGYDNDWYQAIRITYTGAATLSLDYIVDTEPGTDFLQIETDALCSSFTRVNYNLDPSRSAGTFRVREIWADGTILDGQWSSVALTDHGAGTHCAYIAFFSGNGRSPCDGFHATTVGEGAVVDNIEIVDASGTRFEDFEDGTLDIGTFLNLADSAPFGTWARLFPHITDNETCAENRTCAWLWTDYTTPTLFNDPSMSFGPEGFVIKNWLDDIVISPWVSLASTPAATGTFIQFRRFPGNFFTQSRIVQNWSVRGKRAGTGPPCVSSWGHAFQWNSLSQFAWLTLTFDMSSHFDPTVDAIQVRHRTSDWQWIQGTTPPSPFIPGPGPYVDRTRIGRRLLGGPVIDTGIDTRSQAQDAFPTELHPEIPLATGEHHRPTLDRFGTCAFSEGTDLTRRVFTSHLVTGDSTWVQVRGVRLGGEVVTSVQFCGAIVRGPHRGKAPAPCSAGANGFFCFAPDSVRYSGSGQVLPWFYFVDFDDTYFRGGDELHYFWAATDNGGGFTSNPAGLSNMPASVAAAQEATLGLREVSYLPTIQWDQAYLERIAADPHGDLEPTSNELSGSFQENCILYVNHSVSNRRGGDTQRTSFMYTLDGLGYRGCYDVYDHQGMGNTNNHLGGRATIEQAQGYNLIVYDAGNSTPGRPIMPDRSEFDSQKVDQATWFQGWLGQAGIGQAGFATLWVLGSNVVQEKPTNPLYTATMGVAMLAPDQAVNVNPEVVGVTSFTFDRGADQAAVDYVGDEFRLQGGCPSIRNYDALGTNGSGVLTHGYRSPTTGQQGGGAIVMNRNNLEQWNTILQSHPWFDIRDKSGTPANPSPERLLLAKTLNAVLPIACIKSPTATDTGDDDTIDVPRRTALHQNVPNPFNPTTQIRFDLAQPGRVQLRIYDVAGRLVRTFLDGEMQAGWNQSVIWHGLDDQDRRVGSGVYFYRLDAAGSSLTRKLVIMK